MRVLVVDDDTAVRESLARTLHFQGYDVETARDGQAALDAVHADEPDVIILDVSMPRLDGLQACRQLRAEGVLLPVLMLTARDGIGDRVAGLDAGRRLPREAVRAAGAAGQAPGAAASLPVGRPT